MSFLYAVTFGGFVAFSTYLPTYLKDVYDFDLTEAGTRTAGFAIAAVVARPIGGVAVRPDRPAGRRGDLVRRRRRAWRSSSRCSRQPEIPAGIAFVADGGVPGPRHRRRVRLGRRSWRPRSGSAASPGIVGAAGGLGGFFPPLVMGATYNEADHSYTIGLVLLCVTAVCALLFTLFGIRRKARA